MSLQEAAAEQREAAKAHKDWDKEDRREKRVGNWRDFMSGQKAKKKKGGLTVRPTRNRKESSRLCNCSSPSECCVMEAWGPGAGPERIAEREGV